MDKIPPDVIKRTSVHVALVLALGIIVYSNTFNVPFHFDDEIFIITNPAVEDFSYFKEPSRVLSLVGLAPNIRISFFTRFVANLTFALNYRFGGLDVTGYHIVNLLIHLMNALLVYFLALLTFRTPYFGSISLPWGKVTPSRKLSGHHPLTVTPPGSASPPLKIRGGKRGVMISIGGRGSYDPDGTEKSLIPEPQSHLAGLIALFSALLFVAHPLQTEAVTYISQRYTSLATLFYLLSLVMYIKWRLVRSKVTGVRGEGLFFYVTSLLSAVVAMATKEIAFTLPVVIFLYESMFFDGKRAKRLLWSLPYALAVLIIPVMIVAADPKPGIWESLVDSMTKLSVSESIPRTDYLLTQFRVIVTYLRLLFFPVGQNLDHDVPLYHTFFTPAVFISFLFLLSLFSMAVYLLFKSRVDSPVNHREIAPATNSSLLTPYLRLISFGILWFFITLSVESSVIPIADPMFEHRVYLPSAGFIPACVALLFYLRGRLSFTGYSRAVLPALVVITVLFSAAAYRRNYVWGDEIRMWEDAVKKSPMKARSHDYLGVLYGEKGWFEKSGRELKIAADLNPGDFLIRNNLGTAYRNQGRLEDALREYKFSIMINPDYELSHLNLGMVYLKKGLTDEAIQELETAVALDPSDPRAARQLEIALSSRRGR